MTTHSSKLVLLPTPESRADDARERQRACAKEYSGAKAEYRRIKGEAETTKEAFRSTAAALSAAEKEAKSFSEKLTAAQGLQKKLTTDESDAGKAMSVLDSGKQNAEKDKAAAEGKLAAATQEAQAATQAAQTAKNERDDAERKKNDAERAHTNAESTLRLAKAALEAARPAAEAAGATEEAKKPFASAQAEVDRQTPLVAAALGDATSKKSAYEEAARKYTAAAGAETTKTAAVAAIRKSIDDATLVVNAYPAAFEAAKKTAEAAKASLEKVAQEIKDVSAKLGAAQIAVQEAGRKNDGTRDKNQKAEKDLVAAREKKQRALSRLVTVSAEAEHLAEIVDVARGVDMRFSTFRTQHAPVVKADTAMVPASVVVTTFAKTEARKRAADSSDVPDENCKRPKPSSCAPLATLTLIAAAAGAWGLYRYKSGKPLFPKIKRE